ncbi:MAG: type II toxin-antitoxin system VapC family toxin [Gammaproteobacteria bacterium]|nr:type II toxin-antitoxin system VapC family toxin [Gammaproteobacteria bacterium]MYH84527.1 type II toxin-antitoxin system VapC family toxin [Gammaproteobacteria bacterium]MYK03617.1 type II toxin-antitoxin system VapC family toxin [Gammaproteobacteria bacterium]
MIVVDTHVLIWSVADDDRLGKNARSLIERHARSDGILVSAISPWEIALLAEKGRLRLGQEVGQWIEAAMASPGVRLAAIEPRIAINSVRLPGAFHADPADRLIIATARHFDIALLTADKAILSYAESGHVRVLDAAV